MARVAFRLGLRVGASAMTSDTIWYRVSLFSLCNGRSLSLQTVYPLDQYDLADGSNMMYTQILTDTRELSIVHVIERRDSDFLSSGDA